ncbi:MAG: SLC13 family permease [Thermosphaera sp.]
MWRKIALILLLSFTLSTLISYYAAIPNTPIGSEIVEYWRAVTGNRDSINDLSSIFKQSVSLGLFLAVIGLTILSMEYRYYAVFLGISLVTILGIVPPQNMITGVEWNLILFLIGSMTLAFILKSLGVFEYLAIKILEFSNGSVNRLFFTLLFFAWFLSMIVDEATSIVYVIFLVFEIKRLTRQDVYMLAVATVLATNTGSMALPVGNPIGIYLSFTAQLSVKDFLSKSLPLSFILLIVIYTTIYILNKNYLRTLANELSENKVGKRIEAYYSNIRREDLRKVKMGALLILVFLAIVSTVDFTAEILTSFSGSEIQPHSLLSFIPYTLILVAGLVYGPEKLEHAITRGVEWPSILFFISLFMLGFSLLYTGIASKLAYLIIEAGMPTSGEGPGILGELMLVFSAILSSLLDNLSVIVAATPIVKTIEALFSTKKIYWSLLYGSVLGGNFTPIGSTANIVAIGLLDRENIKITWGSWLKIALIPTIIQISIALGWSIGII